MKPPIAVILGIVVALAIPLLATGGSNHKLDARSKQMLGQVRVATAKYKDVKVARRDGFRPPPSCSDSGDGSGAMGLHYTNAARMRDPKIDLLKPEELLYEPQPGGKPPKLVGVEYFAASTGQRPPTTAFGHLDGPMPGHFPGMGTHFDLHVWIFRHNPKGTFEIWNENVHCLPSDTGKKGNG
jgi:hypothetical protein